MASLSAMWTRGPCRLVPADLARSILAHHLDGTVPPAGIYQAFKFRVIAGLAGDEWRLSSEEVQSALEALIGEPQVLGARALHETARTRPVAGCGRAAGCEPCLALKVGEDLAGRDRLKDEGEAPHFAAAFPADQRIDFEPPTDEVCPRPTHPRSRQ